MAIIAALLLLLTLPTFVVGQSMDAEDWDIQFSPGMPRRPTAISRDSWEFFFPTTATPARPRKATVNYVTTRHGAPLAGQMTMSLTVLALSGEPQFDYGFGPKNSCVFPASVRFYFQRFGVGFNHQFSRWWSYPISHQLAPGNTSMTVPFDPSLWLSVYGKYGDQDDQTRTAFATALQNVGRVGMTFGGGCFAGHGVSVSNGTAKFIVTDYKVIP